MDDTGSPSVAPAAQPPGEAPPSTTPAVPLRLLLDRDDLGLRRIAGPGEHETWIHRVHTSEMEDPVPYLLGGEPCRSRRAGRAGAAPCPGQPHGGRQAPRRRLRGLLAGLPG